MHYYTAPEEVIEMEELISAVRTAFYAHGTGGYVMPPKSYVTLPDGDFRSMPSYLPQSGIAGVKIVNVHPENRDKGLPAVMALMVLLDPPTGTPVAIMNATGLTDIRTGASAAVATEALSSRKGGSLGIIGSGHQAEACIRAISQVFKIEEMKIWSRDERHARQLLSRFPDYPGIATSRERAAQADLLVTATPSRTPLILNEWIEDGTHINAIGADAPGKQELDPAILKRGEVFVDDREQAVHSGEINIPVQEGIFSPDEIAGTLGEVLTGKAGRSNEETVTVFDSTGIAITDLAAAALALGKGNRINLPFPPSETYQSQT